MATTLQISIGIKIMLTQNICISKGRLNGPTGTVTGIAYSVTDKEIPAYILVKMDEYKCTTFYENSIPILPKTVT